MQLQDLMQRAQKIRQLYARYEQTQTGNTWDRQALVAGFVGDVGDLVKLAMAKDGLRNIENVDEKFRHELADCLWSLLVIADEYGENDIEKIFSEMTDELEKKLTSKS